MNSLISFLITQVIFIFKMLLLIVLVFVVILKKNNHNFVEILLEYSFLFQ